MSNKSIVKVCSWLLGLVVTVLAGAVWASERLNGGMVTIYEIFPLLGLLAFSLMWTHYGVGLLRRLLKVEKPAAAGYFSFTSALVLMLIVLHPALLIIQLNKDGFGWPPQSYFTVYGEPAMKLAIVLGSIALFIFLVFEFKKRFQNTPWWKVVELLQVVAMLLIFYHGLTLGRELSVGWYKVVWYFYGLSLLSAVFYNYWYDRRVRGGSDDGRKI